MEQREVPFEVWLGNLRTYTEGDLKGEWIAFPQDEETLQKIVDRIAGPDNNELMIMDISTREDCTYLNDIIGEWSRMSDLNVIAKLIGNVPHPAVQAYIDYVAIPSLPELANLLMQEERIPYFTYEFSGCNNPEVMERLSSHEKLGYTMLEHDTGMLRILEAFSLGTSNLLNYVDVEAVGRDLSDSGDFTPSENGYYDMRRESPDLEYYTMEEIKEQLAEKEEQAMRKEQEEKEEQDEEKAQTEKEQSVQQIPEQRKERKRIPDISPSL